MQGFLNKASKAASKAANLAGNKAGEMIEVGKLKVKIKEQRQEAAIALKEIGEIYYALFEEGKIEDPAVIALCEKVKACNAEIDGLENQIQSAKDEYDAKNSMTDL